MTDFQTVTGVKANRAHKCCECRGLIAKGERYIRLSGVFDGEVYSYKMCAPCRDASVWLDGILRSTGYLASDEGIDFGGLHAELAEYASNFRFGDATSLRHLLGMAERREATQGAKP